MVEPYIAALHKLADSCNYGALKEEIIRDWLVVGIRDRLLSEYLQLDVNLTLEKAKMAIRQKEAVHEQQGILKGDSKSNPITPDAVKQHTKQCPLCRFLTTDQPGQQQNTGHTNIVVVMAEDPTNENDDD